MSKILKVSDQTHELVMSLRSEGETVDDVIARYLQTEKETPIEKVTRELQDFKAFIEKIAARTTEKNTSEATPQGTGRKVAGGGRSAKDTFTPADNADPLEKPCCSKDRPCEHWAWRGETMTYVNKLSNRVKEPTS